MFWPSHCRVIRSELNASGKKSACCVVCYSVCCVCPSWARTTHLTCPHQPIPEKDAGNCAGKVLQAPSINSTSSLMCSSNSAFAGSCGASRHCPQTLVLAATGTGAAPCEKSLLTLLIGCEPLPRTSLLSCLRAAQVLSGATLRTDPEIDAELKQDLQVLNTMRAPWLWSCASDCENL